MPHAQNGVRYLEYFVEMRPGAGSLLLRQGLGPAVAGHCAGLLLAAGAVGFLEHLLFGVAPTDPLTWTAVSALLLAVVLAASFLPSLRAVRIDPARTLRAE